MLGDGSDKERLESWSREAKVPFTFNNTNQPDGNFQTNLIIKGAPRAGSSNAPSLEQAHRTAVGKFVDRIVTDARMQRQLMPHVQP